MDTAEHVATPAALGTRHTSTSHLLRSKSPTHPQLMSPDTWGKLVKGSKARETKWCCGKIVYVFTLHRSLSPNSCIFLLCAQAHFPSCLWFSCVLSYGLLMTLTLWLPGLGGNSSSSETQPLKTQFCPYPTGLCKASCLL